MLGTKRNICWGKNINASLVSTVQVVSFCIWDSENRPCSTWWMHTHETFIRKILLILHTCNRFHWFSFNHVWRQGECLAHWWFDDILDNEGFLYTYNDINEWVDLSGVGVGCGDLLDIKAPPGPVPQTHFIAPNYPYSHPPPRVGFVKIRVNCTFFSVEIFVEKR